MIATRGEIAKGFKLEDLYVPIICPNIELKLEGESWVFFTKLDFTSNINFIK